MGHFTITDFTPRDMLRLLEEMPRPTNFLQSMFVKERNTTNKVVLDIDKIFGRQLVARYSSREGDMNVVGKGGFSTNHFVAPYVTEKFCYKPSDIAHRHGHPQGNTPAAHDATGRNEGLGTSLNCGFRRSRWLSYMIWDTACAACTILGGLPSSQRWFSARLMT